MALIANVDSVLVVVVITVCALLAAFLLLRIIRKGKKLSELPAGTKIVIVDLVGPGDYIAKIYAPEFPKGIHPFSDITYKFSHPLLELNCGEIVTIFTDENDGSIIIRKEPATLLRA